MTRPSGAVFRRLLAGADQFRGDGEAERDLLPEPVWAETRMSRPSASGRITAIWTGVGFR